MIGSRLRELRLTSEPRMSIAALAARSGVGAGTIWSIEKGRSDTNTSRAKMLAEGLGVPYVALVAPCPGAREKLRCTLSVDHPDRDHYDHRRDLSWRDGEAR